MTTPAYHTVQQICKTIKTLGRVIQGSIDAAKSRMQESDDKQESEATDSNPIFVSSYILYRHFLSKLQAVPRCETI